MDREMVRYIGLALATSALFALLGCHSDQADTDKKSRPEKNDVSLYTLPEVVIDCPASQLTFNVDERTAQYTVSGPVALVGCRDVIGRLTKAEKSRIERAFVEFAREHPLRLGALCYASTTSLTREALETMEKYRLNLLSHLNRDLGQQVIISFSCELQVVEKL